MAQIAYKKQTATVNNHSPIIEACEKIGVPFGCRAGHCGQCLIHIKNGQENLSCMTTLEDIFGLQKEERLACQCYIYSGNIEIDIP